MKEELTPARKRKPGGEEAGKKSKKKKLRATYTLRTPAVRQAKKIMAEKRIQDRLSCTN